MVWAWFQAGAEGLALVPGKGRHGCPCGSWGCLLCWTGGLQGVALAQDSGSAVPCDPVAKPSTCREALNGTGIGVFKLV